MPLPLPNLDDRTFAQLTEEARRRIPVYAPQWTDHNAHDPGITFIELFAWLAEMQLYSLNRVGDRSYLKFLRLLGTKPRPAAPAQVEVAFTSDSVVTVEKATRLVAEDSQTGQKTDFETDEAIEVLPVSLRAVASYANFKFTEVTEFNAPNQAFYYPFGTAAEIGAALYLGFDLEKAAVAGRQLRLSIGLYEDDLPATGRHGEEAASVHPSAEVAWEYWNGSEWAALELDAETDPMVEALSWSGRLSFALPAGMEESKLPSIDHEAYWVRCRVAQDGYEIAPRIDRVLLNTVSATQGVSIEEDLGTSNGLPHQAFEVGRPPVIEGSQSVIIDAEDWQPVDDLDASSPNDNHYVLDAQASQVIFGDGVRGRVPPGGHAITLTYRCGGGEAGNVGAGAVSRAYDKAGGLLETGVSNARPATGGRRAETIQEAITRALKELKVPARAVTSADFEFIACATPGLRVARARAIPDTQNAVTVVVVPYSPSERALPSPGFLKTVCEHLDRHRLITTGISVVKPQYVRVSVSATVRATPGYRPDAVMGRVVTALDSFLSPLTGGPDGDGWPFGRSVYRSEVYEVIESVDGVDCVQRLAVNGSDKDLDIGALSLVYPGAHSVEMVEAEPACKERA